MIASTGALRRTIFVGLCLGVAVLLLTSSALAGVIPSFPTPAVTASGPGLGTVLVPPFFTISPNNDNVPDVARDDNNIFVPIKRFDFGDYIDLEITVDPSGGTTEYRLIESVDNNTGVDWFGYRMDIGFGVGAAFSQIGGLGDGLDFDTPDDDLPPSSSIMTSHSRPSEDTVLFSGGTHGSGAESYVVRIDVPDMGATAPASYTFTIRQTPILVPEPATLALLSMVLMGAMAYRRRS